MNSHQASRRQFLSLSGASTAAVLLGTGAWDAGPALAVSRRTPYPFSLGVASGDPAPDSVVLWTRLAPEPFAADGSGGMGARAVRVEYQLSADARLRRVVRTGSVVASPSLGHSVHPEIAGLEPDRMYWYRFRCGDALSPVGRTRTLPTRASSPKELRFAFVSCQAWHDGYFSAYDHLSEEDLDLIVHLGDYIYERGLVRDRGGRRLPPQFASETVSLGRYRLQYALYKSDRSLQRAHARFPWLQTIDDHEVENNFAGLRSQADSEPDQDRAVFRRRRAAAFQAMYENMPLRRAQLPSAASVRLHRRVRYGQLADFTMLDTRQYRSDQPCGDGVSATCGDRFARSQTMLGGRQKAWLLKVFSRSTARWQILGNQAPMGQTDEVPGPRVTQVALDPWDGYVAERNALLAAARDRDVRNLIVITGDRHSNYVQNLRLDYQRRRSPLVGTEFVGTSVSSGGDGEDIDDAGRRLLAANADMEFYNFQRGYTRVRVTPTRLHTDFRVLPYVSRPGAPVRTRASFVVHDGRPGADRAS